MLGSPIAHSLSPALHTAAYAHLGLDWRYERHEVEAADLAAFVAGCDASWRGLSLTKPLKEAALDLGEADRVTVRVHAANTLIFDPDGIRLYNTDVPGLVAAVRAAGVTAAESVTLLGAGATARSALVATADLGARQVTVRARRRAQAEELAPLAAASGLDLLVADWTDRPAPTDLLIATVAAEALTGTAAAWASAARAVFDVVYDPWPTPLAAAAGQAGRPVINGLDLLVHQAVGQIERMTGRTVDPGVLMSAGRKSLGRRGAA